MTVLERQVLDQLSRDLDEIERTTKMIDNYARMTPEIVEHTQAGVTYKFIIYHHESKSWFGDEKPDGAMAAVKRLDLLRPDDVVFDLGCNSGYHTTWFAKLVPNGHVHSFDPFPWNTAATKAQAMLNGCTNVTTHTVGLGNSQRTITTDVTGSKTFNAGSGRKNYSMNIEICTPDSYLRYNPTFLKIDIEGAEYELGDTKLLSHWSVQRGYVEMHTAFIKAGGGEPAFFLDQLVKNRFEVLDSRHTPMTSFPEVKETAYYFRRPVQKAPVAERLKAAVKGVFA